MAKIPLIDGGFATVDDESFDLLRHFKWRKCGFCGHIYRTVRRNLEIGDFTIYLASEALGVETLGVRGGCNPCPAIRD